MAFTWKLATFDQLSTHELYAILRLRSEVFVVEQNCVFLDMDDKDQPSLHLMCWDNDHLAACCRLVPPGIAYEEASIGRVVSSPARRGQGAGLQMMQHAIQHTCDLFEVDTIKIGAQLYLEKFYGSLGFVSIGDTYLEDGIPHIHMLLKQQ
jgi:ElaA protein